VAEELRYLGAFQPVRNSWVARLWRIV